MTAEEIKIARALKGVKLPFASKTKVIVVTLAVQTLTNPEKALTQNQRRALLNIAMQFSAQLPDDIVELVKALKEQSA